MPHSERNAKDLGLKQAPLVLRWSFEHLLQASWHAPGSPAGPGLGSSFCLPVPPTSCLSDCLKENANLLCSAQACPSKCNSQTGTSSWWVVSDPGCQSPGSQWDCGPASFPSFRFGEEEPAPGILFRTRGGERQSPCSLPVFVWGHECFFQFTDFLTSSLRGRVCLPWFYRWANHGSEKSRDFLNSTLPPGTVRTAFPV